MITSIDFYKNDIVINRERLENPFIIQPHKTVPEALRLDDDSKPSDRASKRGKITQLSVKSRKRLAFTACNTQADIEYMSTLTYPKEYTTNGKVVKYHLKKILMWVKANGGGEYIWFLEFQKRGAPHFHVLHEGELDKVRLSEIWYKIVGSGDEKHLRAGTRTERIRKVDGAARYAVKYAFKPHQKLVPPNYQDVGRFWGASQGARPKPVGRVEVTRVELLELLREWSQFERLGESSLDLRVLYGASYDVVKAMIEDGL